MILFFCKFYDSQFNIKKGLFKSHPELILVTMKIYIHKKFFIIRQIYNGLAVMLGDLQKITFFPEILVRSENMEKALFVF